MGFLRYQNYRKTLYQKSKTKIWIEWGQIETGNLQGKKANDHAHGV